MRLSELLDMSVVQKLAEANYTANGMPLGIVDAVDGAVLVGWGWQEICVRFHRANALALERCRESDAHIADHLSDGAPCEYRCRNGLRDIGIPISAAGEHLATLFLGQFFYEGEAPDRAFFAEQARRYGFDEASYLAALDRVPVFSRASVQNILAYDIALARFISDLAEGAIRSRRAEALAESLARFPEENPDPVLRIGEDLVVLYANGAARTHLRDLHVEAGAAAPPELAALARRALAGKTRVRAEVQCGERLFSMSLSCAPGAVNVYANDITARKRADDALRDREERLREAMQRLESLLENSPLAVVEWSSVDFRIARWSDEATRMFGWTAQETVGKRLDELALVPPEGWPAVEQVMRDMLSGARPRNVSRNRNRRKDGALIHCEWYNSMVTDAAGRLTGALSLVLDVTERERIEQELRDASRRKDEFLAILSHELRNPLAPIRNALYILDHADPAGPQARRAREVASRQLSHLARLVDDLLDVTRIVRGKVELRRSRIDVADLAWRTGEDYRAVMDERGVALTVEVPPGPAWIEGDPARIVQIIGNLLQNAARFTPSGGAVTLSVCAAGEEIEISVADTGAGIDPALVGRLFEPFVQGEQSLARTEGGLGLGLALVKGLAEQHGGAVAVASEGIGRGARFTVRLPLHPGSGARSDAAGAGRAAGTRRRVLVVDDNRDAAESLAELVRILGHDAEVAFDGASAIARAIASAPEVVLCDIGLPDISGYEVARALRADARSRGARLVAVSGYTRPEDRARAAEAGFEDHVPKPPDPEKIERLLARWPPGAGGPAPPAPPRA